MATVTERANARSLTGGKNGQRSIGYIAEGYSDESAAATAILAAAAGTFGAYVLSHVSNVHETAYETWEGDAQYVLPSNKQREPADAAVGRFSTTGGSAHIITGKAASTAYVAAGTAVDHKGLIGVTKDSVEGCDIVVPVFRWSETLVFAEADVDDAYKNALFRLTSKTNNATFRMFAAGECLFEGAEGQQRADGKWEITFNFAGSPNVTGLTIGGITGIAKGGWQYLWITYRDVVSSDRLTKNPIQVNVETVYYSGDFGDLVP